MYKNDTSQDRIMPHNHLLSQLQLIIGEKDRKTFQLAIQEFEKGLDDSSHYNRGLRRLCTLSHKKIPLLLIEIFRYRFILKISPTETNKENKSALDYAKLHNPPAHKLILELQKEEYNQLTQEMAQQLLNKFFGEQDITFSPFAKPISFALNEQQKEKIEDTTTKITQELTEMLPGLMNLHSLDPESANLKLRQATEKMVKSIVPNHSASVISVPEDSRKLLSELEELARGDQSTAPFVDYCKEGKYADALWFAPKCTNQALIIKLVDRLLDYSRVLNLEINSLKNQEGQTVLHVAALSREAPTSGWALYYTLVGKGANSFLTDYHDKTPADYRRQRQMNFLGTGHNPIAPLYGLVPGMDPDSGNCSIS